MTYNDKNEMYMLSTGREFYACRGIVGIGPKRDQIFHGRDGDVWTRGEENWRDAEFILTPTERIEIARQMIQRWANFISDAEQEMTDPAKNATCDATANDQQV